MTLSDVRSIIAIIGGGACAYAICALIPFTGLTITDFGVGVAVSAACVVVNGAIRAAQRGKSYHPSSQHTRRTP